MARAQTDIETTPKKRRKNGSAIRRRQRPVTARSARGIMQEAVSGDVAAMRAEVNDMIATLEAKIQRLNSITNDGASHAAGGANDIVLNAIAGLTGRMTGSLQNNVHSASDEVAKFGNQALKRIVSEIDHRPFLTLAIAAGIGFIAGLARRE